MFYFNRLFATLVSYALRAYTWHKYRVYIDIQTLQLSLLGGRVFFKGIRYHGENETIFVQNGHITWRYWLQNVQEVDHNRLGSGPKAAQTKTNFDNGHDGLDTATETGVESGGSSGEDKRPCRIAVHLSGLEWFIYNRTPAYDTILKSSAFSVSEDAGNPKAEYSMGNEHHTPGDSMRRQSRLSKRSQATESVSNDPRGLGAGDSEKEAERNDGLFLAETLSTMASFDKLSVGEKGNESLALLGLLPFEVYCSKGAIILGNEHTTILLANTFERAEGKINAANSGPLDVYREIIDFDIVHPIVQMRPNPDYRTSQLETAERLADEGFDLDAKKGHHFPKWHLQRKSRRAFKSLRDMIPYFQRSVESFHATSSRSPSEGFPSKARETYTRQGRWFGLTRYLDDDAQDEHEVWKSVDYARFSTILDCPSLNVKFFWDIPGPVRKPLDQTTAHDVSQRVNGAEQPAYGLDVVVRGGLINYGPWADKARAEIQNVFFPNPFTDAVPARPLKPGEKRLSTTFNMHIDIEEETTIRIPTRESSKDWQWRGRAEAVSDAARLKRSKNRRHVRQRKVDKNILGPDIRPFGWLGLVIEANSTVSFAVDMLPGESAFETNLQVDLKGTRMTSSVNHGILWRCGPQTVSSSMPNPLGWNTLREWTFTIHSQSFELFILRDHMFLLIDLVDDWSQGPPPEYLTFIPFKYHINLDFSDLKLYLNTNDANIIDDPTELADNTYLIIGSQSLTSKLEVPVDNYRPSHNSINFQAVLRDTRLDLTTPLWDTFRTFLGDDPLGTLKELTLDGSYNYGLDASPSNTDSLMLDMRGFAPKLYLHGFLIRQFIKLNDNYFGEDVHFRTLAEFQERNPANTPTEPQDLQSQKSDDELDVILTIQVDEGIVLLPGNLYSRKENIQLDILLTEAEMRFNNYYGDINVRFSPIEALTETLESEGTSNSRRTASRTQLFLDGLEIYGHRMLGLAPTEPAYLCNWDFHVGKVLGECSTLFLRTLITSIRALVFTLDDTENALPLTKGAIVHDVTFLRAFVESVRIWVLIGDAAVLIGIGSIEIGVQDWAGELFSERLNFKIPDIIVATVDLSSANIRREHGISTLPATGAIATSMDVKILQQVPELAQNRALQSHHVQLHDQRTRRVEWMTEPLPKSHAQTKPAMPTMPVPPMPAPLEQVQGLQTKKPQIHESSFLSTDAVRQVHEPSKSSALSSVARSGDDSRVSQHPSYDEVRNRSTEQSTLGTHQPAVKYSSPWSPPHFSLAFIEPDLTHLPAMPRTVSGTSLRDSPDSLTSSEDSKARHDSIICTVKPGLVGFLTPVVMKTVGTLLEEFSPSHPLDILDELQMDCVTEIEGIRKLASKPSKHLDVQLQLPHVHVKATNTYSSYSGGAQSSEQDTYTTIFRNMQCTMRFSSQKQSSSRVGAPKRYVTLQAVGEEISLVVSEKSAGAHHDKAAIHGTLKDIVLWMTAGGDLTADLQLRSIDFTTWSRRINYLAMLIHRSVALFEDIAEDLRRATLLYSQSLKHLTYILASEGKHIADPTFLTRPSYVLRAAGDHLRITDSWKIISRLRHIYQSLPSEAQERTLRQSLHHDSELPSDAQNQFVANLHQWRAWDLAHLDQSLVLQKIWGMKATPSEQPYERLRLGMSLGSTRLILDPGPKQNEVALGDLAFLALMQSLDETEALDAIPRRSLGIRIYTAKVALRLNWEICDLLDDLLALFDSRSRPSETPSTASGSVDKGVEPITDVHLVFGTDYGIITLDTVNVKVAMVAKGLKGSTVHQPSGVPNILPSSTSLLSASSASTEIIHEGHSIMTWRIWAPSLYFALVIPDNPQSAIDLKVAANCEKLYYSVKVDVPHLAEIIDKIVQDEIAFFIGVYKKTNRPPVEKAEPVPQSRPRLRISVALFLDNYQLSVSLLPTLTYVIAGEIARTAMTPQAGGSLRVDFDLQRHNHSFYSKGRRGGNAFSTLKLPPVNGSIDFVQWEQVSVAKVGISIEQIKLDGAALRALVDLASRPEIGTALDNSKRSIRTTTSRLESLLPPSKKNAHSAAGQPKQVASLLYTANVTLAGLSVYTVAPAPADVEKSSSDLKFALSVVRLTLHNQRNEEMELFSKPQFRFTIRQISLDLQEHRQNNVASYGSIRLAIIASGTTETDETGSEVQNYRLSCNTFDVDLFPETASLVTSIASHLQERIRGLDFSQEPIQQIRRFTRPSLFDPPQPGSPEQEDIEEPSTPPILLDSVFVIELSNIQANWIVPDESLFTPSGRKSEDLVLSVKKIGLTTKRENSARLAIDDLQLQMVPKSTNKRQRTLNSALLPEVVFNVAYAATGRRWRMAFQAAGKALDLRLTSDFILPASAIQGSLAAASQVLRDTDAFTTSSAPQSQNTKPHIFGKKKLSSLLIDADFAGAVVTIQERPTEEHASPFSLIKGNRRAKGGRYEQFVRGENTGKASLRAPGVALKVEFQARGEADPTLNAEVKVAASKNTLNPTVVPLILEISSSVQEAVGDDQAGEANGKAAGGMTLVNGPIGSGDPSAILGRTKLNLGLWVQEQEFSMTCQPIARVAASARFDHIFMTVNTVQSAEQSRFYSMLLSFNSLSASVQHVYSRESTASFAVESIVVSLMNSKHISSRSGISAIINISPMKTTLNAKQVQDFLLFQEIWYPPEIRGPNRPRTTPTGADSQLFAVQRYQQVAAASAFPWNAVVSIAELGIEADFGQGLGKTIFAISKLWVSSSKSSELEQNLCMGFERISIDASGRMSGFVEMQNFKLRTSIRWPSARELGNTPLIQASAGFDGLRIKASFDYQPFLIADITTFAFFMFNVRDEGEEVKDRLVGILEGDKVQVFCTTASASLGLALSQAFARLVQEKQAAFEASIKELDRFLRRRSVFPSGSWAPAGGATADAAEVEEENSVTAPLTLHTDVVVTLKAVNIGAFPSTFFDNQIFKVEASNAEARFGVASQNTRTHSGLGLTLGQLRVALASVNRNATHAFGEVSIDDVVNNATGSRGGTILNVPKVVASMETWQTALSNHIDYIFKSKFEGKVDVGWNYARISFIRGMWTTHSQALANRLGKPLPRSAVQITGGPKPDDPSGHEKGQEKITAVVNVPQSRFEYTALEPPIIETPQLRDMGEATPPLEWIGLQRDRLPHLTHQIIIVTLLEVAREVEDAYSRILGSSSS